MLVNSLEESSSIRALPWHALKVRAGSEPVARTALQNRGYELFAPTIDIRKRYSDRIKSVAVPAFPGYVFCRFDSREKVPIVSSPAVDYVVSFGGVPAIIPDHEIDSIRRAIIAGAEPADYIAEGDRVRIESGALAGIEGLVCRIGGSDRLIVSIHLLRRSVAVEVPLSNLRAISKTSNINPRYHVAAR